jgi:hypothetical protein
MRPVILLTTVLALMFKGSSGGALGRSSGSTSFILDGNRVYADLAFVRRDGSVRRTLAYVDMGSPKFSIASELVADVRRSNLDPIRARIGAFRISVEPSAISIEANPPSKIDGRKVEAVLGANILERYQVVFDYTGRRLTLAAPGTLKPSGVPTEFQLNDETGLIAVNTSIGAESFWMTIDNGSAWSWVRQSKLNGWLRSNAACRRGMGAVGASNMMMVGDLEATGVVARLPIVRIGQLRLTNVDVLGPGPTAAFPFELFDWYSRKNAVPVLGWIGGNVLKRYRLFIDYPRRTVYWQREALPDLRELNQVGLTLRRTQRRYFVAGIAQKQGKMTVQFVQPGDELVRVNGTKLQGASLGTVYNLLHGRPGETRTLLLERDAKLFEVSARVTAF